MASIKEWKANEPYLALGGDLLEGPMFDERQQHLWWVDLALDRVYCIDVSEGPESLRTFNVDGNTVATLATIQDGPDDLLLAGAKRGFATFNTTSGEISYYCNYFSDEENTATTQRRFRANDGAIDARGRILQGILLDDRIEPPAPEGKLISMDPISRQTTLIVSNATTPNGLAWNSTNTTMYWAESFSGNTYAFDYDIETGQASKQRVFFHLDGHDNVNVPDGLVVDEEDHIWLAVWGGSEVLRLSPGDASVVGRVCLPTRFVTCPVFVGTRLFITTAKERSPREFPDSARFGGHLYSVDVGVRGLSRFSGVLPVALGRGG